MRKKLMLLTLGVVAFCSVSFAQTTTTVWAQGFTQQTENGNLLYTATWTDAHLGIGSLITYQDAGGHSYLFQVNTAPVTNPAGLVSTAANNIYDNFNLFLRVISTSGTFGITNPGAGYGNAPGQWAVQSLDQVQVPFDFGLSAVLGMGAIAAAKSARKRRKQQATA